MAGRSFSSDSYRYGFNGQEKDDEVTGNSGTSYTAEYWQYDSRLGRRWNIDPVVKPWESPYAAFSNNPIFLIDPTGADTLTAESVDKVMSNLEKLKSQIDASDDLIARRQTALEEAKAIIDEATFQLDIANAVTKNPILRAANQIANKTMLAKAKLEYAKLVKVTNEEIETRNYLALIYNSALFTSQKTLGESEAIGVTKNQFGYTYYLDKQSEEGNYSYTIYIDRKGYFFGRLAEASEHVYFFSSCLMTELETDPYALEPPPQ